MRRLHFVGLVSLIFAVIIVGAWAIGVDDLFPPPWPNAPLPPQGPPPADATPLTDSISPENCAKCHSKQYKEWSDSMHSQSFVDPIHQAILAAEGIPFCSGCHLPLNEQTPGFVDFATGEFTENPNFQPELMDRGVMCAVCHVREWVRYGPPEEDETEEEASQIHEVRFVEDYEKSEFCAKCHQETLEHIPGTPLEVIPPGTVVLWDNTYGEWQAWQESLPEEHRAKGRQCQGCHMPDGEHSWKGGHSSEMLERAADVEVITDKEAYMPGETVSASISVTNAGAGHKFPSGGSGGNNRMVTIEVSVVDADGNVVDTQQFPPIWRQMMPPPDIFIEVSDNRLLPGETRTFDYSFTIPDGVEGQLYLNTQVAYFLTPPFLFEAFGAPELIEEFPPTIIHDESRPLILEKDYSSVFFAELRGGLNMVSLPLEIKGGHTARSFAGEIGSTVIIELDEETGKFTGFSLASPGDGFPIKGGKGYIINVDKAKTVVYTGAAWENEPNIALLAPGRDASSAWAFVLNGEVYDRDGSSLDGEYVVTARNRRTGAIAVDTVKSAAGSAYFAAVWADLSKNSVIQVSDVVEITIADTAGNQIAEPVIREISDLDIRDAFATVRMNVSKVPFMSELGQNYPNPCNPETWIPFKLVEDADVVVKIYETSGRLIRRVDLGYRSAGYYTSRSTAAYWDGKNNAGEAVASGVYFYSIEASGFTATKKLLIAK